MIVSARSTLSQRGCGLIVCGVSADGGSGAEGYSEVEDLAKGRISFSQFAGLSMEDGVPDYTIVCRFRNIHRTPSLHIHIQQ